MLVAGDRYRCSVCEVECKGRPDGICGCGLLPGRRPMGKARPTSPFRCVANPARGPQSPAAIVISRGEAPVEAATP